MNSDVELCNEALGLIGSDVIMALTEDTKEGRYCTLYYVSTRDAVQRAHPWNVCIERASLARLADAPAFGYSYQYTLPADPYCLRVLQMEDLDDEFKVERRNLLTDQAEAKIIYIARREAVAEFDALLKKAIAARMACQLARPLADSGALARDMWKLYTDTLSEARSIDAQEGTPEEIAADTWLNARR